MTDALVRRETEKYARVWAMPGYGRRSPGALVAKHALRAMGARQGETIIDYGCGTGGALRVFRRSGFDARGVDLVDVVASDVDAPVTIAPLWDLPDSLDASDWCFCCDVLEHLPEDQVAPALAGIAARTRRGGFVQPALTPDRSGPRLIGEPLHLTVRPRGWWLEQIAAHFAEVREIDGCGTSWQLSLVVSA